METGMVLRGCTKKRVNHLCCIAHETKKNFQHFPLNIIETGVWPKSSPHKAWCNTVIVLLAFSLLRHRGATARRPEP